MDIEEAVHAEGGEVLDSAGGRAYLVEVGASSADALRQRLSGWSVELESEIDLPDFGDVVEAGYRSANQPADVLESAAMTTDDRAQTVLDTLQRFLTAAEQGDIATLDTLLTPDFTYTHATTAQQDSRATWLNIYRPESPTYRRYRVYQVFDTTVRLYPGTAIVFGHGHQEIVRPNGDEVDLNTTFTCTWVERDGRWLLVAWQATKKPD